MPLFALPFCPLANSTGQAFVLPPSLETSLRKPGFRHSAPFSVMPPLRQAQGASSPRTLRAPPRRRRFFWNNRATEPSILGTFQLWVAPSLLPSQEFHQPSKALFRQAFQEPLRFALQGQSKKMNLPLQDRCWDCNSA